MKDITRYFQLPPAEIAYIGFVVHSYEGLAVVRTLEAKAGLIEMLVAPDFQEDLQDLLDALAQEVPMRELPPAEIRARGLLQDLSDYPCG
jgi:hypothetical protein